MRRSGDRAGAERRRRWVWVIGGTAAPPAGPIDLLAGTFISHEHETTGSARIIENPDGTRYLG